MILGSAKIAGRGTALLCTLFLALSCSQSIQVSGGVSAGGITAAGALADTAAGAADRPPIVVVHAWQIYEEYRDAVAKLPNPEDEGARLQTGNRILLAPENRYLRGFFAHHGGGDAEFSLSEWVTIPSQAFDSVDALLADDATRKELLSGAEDLVQRLHRIPAASDSVVLVFAVGGFQRLYTSYQIGNTSVIVMQLETFAPQPGELDPETGDAIEFATQWRPDRLPEWADLMPWTVYAYMPNYAYELRDRMREDTANLAEFVLYQGFAAQLAGVVYPGSVFGGGAAQVREPARGQIDALWREIGASWFPFGTEPYLSALYEDQLSEVLPQGTSVEQAAAVIGTRLAVEWLDATRIERTVDLSVEITGLGRLPTLSAWQLLELP